MGSRAGWRLCFRSRSDSSTLSHPARVRRTAVNLPGNRSRLLTVRNGQTIPEAVKLFGHEQPRAMCQLSFPRRPARQPIGLRMLVSMRAARITDH